MKQERVMTDADYKEFLERVSARTIFSRQYQMMEAGYQEWAVSFKRKYKVPRTKNMEVDAETRIVTGVAKT